MNILHFKINGQHLQKVGDFSGIIRGTKNYLKCIKTINNKSVTSLNELVDDVNEDSKSKIEIQDLIPSKDELIEDTITNNCLIENIRDLLKKCNLKEIEIPNSCTKIATNAFAGCQNLETIKINKKENSISGAPWGAVKGLKVVKWGD